MFHSLFTACKKSENKTEIPLPDIASGLVAYIPLDGSAVETIGNIQGTIMKAVPCPDHHGSPDKAYSFSSFDSAYIDFGNINALSFTTNIFTMTCRVKVSDTTSNMAVFSKRGVTGPFEYSLDNHFNKGFFKLDNWVSNGTTTVYGIDPLLASAPIFTNAWHHITIVADGNNLVFYEDGIKQNGTDVKLTGKSFSNTTGNFVIGNGGGYGKNYFFNGSIDELRFYNRVLDEAAIQLLAAQ